MLEMIGLVDFLFVPALTGIRVGIFQLMNCSWHCQMEHGLHLIRRQFDLWLVNIFAKERCEVLGTSDARVW